MEIALSDSRKLAYEEYGDLHGKPVFLFHGIPGSRIFRPPLDDLTARFGVRLITIDRPGYGGSTYQRDRTFIDFVDDVIALANHLSLDRFAVIGHSGGAPYVAACALKIPNRITHAAIVSGLMPLDDPSALEGMMDSNRMGMKFGKYIPWFIWHILMNMFYGSGHEHPETLIKLNDKNPNDPDNAMLAMPGAFDICRESVREGLRPGLIGHAWEGYLHTRVLGFKLGKIEIPVHVWQGTHDIDTPINMGRAIAKSIPRSILHVCEGEGHLLLFRHWEEILGVLTE